jgi:type I restriction enzyme, R subunit
VSKDEVIFSGFDAQAKEKAQGVIANFQKFIQENKDEITALQIFYNRPYGQRHLTFAQIEELATAIKMPPYRLTPELVWKAYERLEKSRVRGVGHQKLLTDLISLIRFTLGESEILEPFAEDMNRRFNKWLAEQKLLGRNFTLEQLDWIVMIKDHLATSLSVDVEDLELAPFFEKGGPVKAFHTKLRSFK